MSVDLMRRAAKLDDLRLQGVAEKLTLVEADHIVAVWGSYLEHSGGLRIIFGHNIPESLLPYPIAILQGALNKMEEYYFQHGKHDRVKLLEEIEVTLMQYTNDEEAIEEALALFGNKRWQEAITSSLKDYQKTQAQSGYLVDGKLWKLSESRINELEE
jgi:hypothetical protein